MFRTKAFLSDITESVPSLPSCSCSCPYWVLPSMAPKVRKQLSCVSSEDTISTAATADSASGKMLPGVCTKAVPAEGTEVHAKGSPPPPTMATKYRHHLPAKSGPSSPVTSVCSIFAMELISECPCTLGLQRLARQLLLCMSPSYHSRTQTHLGQACVQCEQETTNGFKVSSPSTLSMHAFQGPPGSFLRTAPPTDSACQAPRQAQYIQLHFLLHMKYSTERTKHRDAKKVLFLPCFSLYILQPST